ncbi:hypothetical protein I8751_19660 [Nostocaceae cyanobacterium CENA357]|uniref:Uncharacterized protein n=1 Tax=Atlanticothrix silvestris CENA357 TaxID=1725252 RepID=A0A8J7HKA2_9CYAN|nr:hypothetical protein [Atlanticothrix silvestris]MBH8554539.1 hypothetical protein [Atlanticothrix silvestris CENA357]
MSRLTTESGGDGDRIPKHPWTTITKLNIFDCGLGINPQSTIPQKPFIYW